MDTESVFVLLFIVATDPIVVIAMLQSLRTPRRLSVLLEEEHRAHELARGRARAIQAALAELDRMKGASPIAAEMLEPLRRDYEARLEQVYEQIRRIHLQREEISREEMEHLRHHLILTEKQQLVEAFREGQIGVDVYEELQADMDARLLELDSQEIPPPTPHRES